VDGELLKTGTKVIDVGRRAVGRDDDETGFARGACIDGLSLTEQKSARAGCGFQVSA